jgi:hypothetical protein
MIFSLSLLFKKFAYDASGYGNFLVNLTGNLLTFFVVVVYITDFYQIWDVSGHCFFKYFSGTSFFL